MSPLALSLQIAVIASALAGALALGFVMLTHGRRSASLFDAFLTAPLVLPPTVLGYYLLTILGRRSGLGHAWEALTGNSLVFTRTGAIVAATITALPLVLQSARAAIDAVDPALLEAARTLGATRLQVLRRVALPLASRGIAAGLLLGFARACGDFGVTLMIAGNIPGETQTAALALYDAVLANRDADAQALAISLTVIAVVLIASVQWLGRRAHAR
ncbi:MAG TPA: molybdate ABC transporter permease subunit [Archangium sp.]